MKEQTSEALRAWFKRVEPCYAELFNTAYAICGNYDLAEEALRGGILEVWMQNADGGMGFREKLRSAVRDEALQLTRDGADIEITWPGFDASSDDVLAQQAARERIEVQRALVLRYGAGLPGKRIARLTGLSTRQLSSACEHFEARCRRILSGQETSRFATRFGQTVRDLLSSRANIPHPSGVYRAFESEASGMQLSEHTASRVVYRIIVLAMALICAAMFWLFAVLVHTPDTGTSAVPHQNAGTEVAPSHDPYAPSVETVYQTEAPTG